MTTRNKQLYSNINKLVKLSVSTLQELNGTHLLTSAVSLKIRTKDEK